jgi:hypothetical protein
VRACRWPPRGLTVAAGLLIVCQTAQVAAFPASASALGANKFDLMLDYVAPAPPAGADPAGYRRVRRAMAEKAILDARDAGLTFFRVAVTGYGPTEFNASRHDLSLWQNDPPQFWAALDRMFDDLDAAGIRLVPSFVWNLAQFPALGNDTTATFLRDPDSASRRLLAQFLRDFIGRYKARETILFYELGNELSLLADLDEHKRNCKADPCVWGNFTTADMNEFARRIAGSIKSLDPSRGVSSGYSVPRGNATHLEHQPEFSARGADWTPDTAQEFARNLIAIHQPFDIVSIHVYPEKVPRPSGRDPGETFDPVARAAEAARAAGKKLFVGEFGDEGVARPHIAHLLDEIVRERVDFAAIWVWEFYQTSTYTRAPGFNIEPGYDDDVISLLTQTATRAGMAPPPRKAAAPRVVLTWPLPCAAIDRSVELAAVASDGARRIERVEFLVDGQPLAASAAPPYRAAFDPAGQAPHIAEIEARGIAASGATAAFRSTVHLNGDKSRCGPTD